MHDNFVDWYKLIDPEPRPDALEASWRGVEALTAKKKLEYWLDYVRLLIGVTPVEVGTASDFVAAFKHEDPTFTATNNQMLLQVLAGATIIHGLSSETRQHDLTALALVSANFKGHVAQLPFAAPIEAATDYLMRRSRSARSPRSGRPSSTPFNPLPDFTSRSLDVSQNQWPQLQAAIQQLGQSLDLVEGAIQQLHGDVQARWETSVATRTRLAVLEEETNILWWVFGGYSRDFDKPISDLEFPGSCLILAKELADHTRIVPGHLAARAVLYKAITTATPQLPDDVPVADAVDSTPRGWREVWIKATGDELVSKSGRLTPLHRAVSASLTTNKEGEWKPVFETATGLSSSISMSALDLAEQTYQECLLLRELSVEGQ